MPQKPLQYYTLAQAADYLGIHKNFLRVKLQNGEIKFDCLDACNRPMFRLSTLNRYITENQKRPVDNRHFVPESELRVILEKLDSTTQLNLQTPAMLAMARLGVIPAYNLDAHGSYRCYHKDGVLRFLDFLREQRLSACGANAVSQGDRLYDADWTQDDEDALNAIKEEIQDRW